MGRQRWVPAANEVDTLIMFSALLSVPILRQEGDQMWADPSSSHGWRVGRGTPTWQEAEPVWGSPKAPDSPALRARRNSCHSQPRHREDSMGGGRFVGWRSWTLSESIVWISAVGRCKETWGSRVLEGSGTGMSKALPSYLSQTFIKTVGAQVSHQEGDLRLWSHSQPSAWLWVACVRSFGSTQGTPRLFKINH